MAVTLNGSATATEGSVSHSWTVPSLANGCLVGFYHAGDGGPSAPSSCTWNSLSLTEGATGIGDGDYMVASIWYRLAPGAAGPTNLAFNDPGNQDDVAGAANFEGVDSVDGGANDGSNSGSLGVTVASETDGLVISAGTLHNATPSSGSGTALTSGSEGSLGYASQYDAGAASVSPSWSGGGDGEWNMAGISLNPLVSPVYEQTDFRVFKDAA